MINAIKTYVKQHIPPLWKREKNPVVAYDIWAENYDSQPGNMMLDIDELTLEKLIKNVAIKGKDVADIGCGTGRHWFKIKEYQPLSLTGFDVSAGMLAKLHQKFPTAKTHHITDNLFTVIPDQSYDVIISTLTVAHIKNLEQALNAWSRILKPKSELIITDFHPKTLQSGGKRTFSHQNKLIAVQNFVHHTNQIIEILSQQGFELVAQEEIVINESFKHYYTNKNALSVYQNYKGFPILYGLHFKRTI